MTQLFSLLNHVFAHHSNSHDLERYININNPTTHQELEELTRDYLSTARGM